MLLVAGCAMCFSLFSPYLSAISAIANNEAQSFIKIGDDRKMVQSQYGLSAAADDTYIITASESDLAASGYSEILITDGGVDKVISFSGSTVSQAIAASGIEAPDNDDIVEPSMTERCSPDTHIVITRISYDEYVAVETIPFITITIDTPSLPAGEKNITTLGSDGEKRVVYQRKWVNGELDSETVLNETITREPVSEVVEVGVSKVGADRKTTTAASVPSQKKTTTAKSTTAFSAKKTTSTSTTASSAKKTTSTSTTASSKTTVTTTSKAAALATQSTATSKSTTTVKTTSSTAKNTSTSKKKTTTSTATTTAASTATTTTTAISSTTTTTTTADTTASTTSSAAATSTTSAAEQTEVPAAIETTVSTTTTTTTTAAPTTTTAKPTTTTKATEAPVSDSPASSDEGKDKKESSNDKDNTFVDSSGRTVAYSKMLKGKGTAYTEEPGSLTSTGCKVGVGLVAVDPKVIPYNSKLYIVSADGKYVYGYATAADTGGALRSGAVLVDLFYNTEDECNQFGRRDVIVYIL